MAFVLADRVEETSATAGTGPLALAGASPGGFRTFGSVMATGDTTRYTYYDPAAGVWETGLGTFAAGASPTLSRAPSATSAGGTAPLALPGNPAARVFISPDAAHFASLAPLASPAFSGFVGVAGTVHFSNDLGRKIDVFDDGTRSYGIGLNASELALYAGDNAAVRVRVGTQGPDAPAVATIDAAGINATPIGATAPAAGRFTSLSAAETNTDFLRVGNSAATNTNILFNGAAGTFRPLQFQTAGVNRWTLSANNYAETGANAGTSFELAAFSDTGAYLSSPILVSRATGAVTIANIAATGGSINGASVGATTPGTGRFTTLAVTDSLAAKLVLAAPNAAAGAPAWRQLLASDVSGLGALATADPAAPPPLGATTANTGRFSTLTATGFLLRSMATGLTASATNTQAGALGLTASINNITTAAANSAVRLPNAAPAANTAAEIIVRNGGANAVNVFPVSGASINALAANAAFSLAAGATARFQQLSATLYVTA